MSQRHCEKYIIYTQKSLMHTTHTYVCNTVTYSYVCSYSYACNNFVAKICDSATIYIIHQFLFYVDEQIMFS